MADGQWTPRPWADADAGEIAALQDRVSAGDPTARGIQDVHGPSSDAAAAFARTLVTAQGGMLVAAGTIWESAFAPARWRLSLHVHPNHRRRGIGSALLAALLALTPGDGRSIQTGVRADDSAALGFLACHGFHHLMRTRLGTVDPARMPPRIWHRLDTASRRAAAAGYRTSPIPDASEYPSGIAQIATLHAEIYRQTHAWSPPAPISATEAAAAFLGPDLIPDALFVALDDDTPIGVASLRHGLLPGDIDLGWTGVLAEHTDAAPDSTAALLNRCLSHARDQGWTVRIEVDEADPILWRLLDVLPVSWEPDWLNLERASLDHEPSAHATAAHATAAHATASHATATPAPPSPAPSSPAPSS